MRSCCNAISVSVIVALLFVPASAAPFVVFPMAGQLVSPDGRFVVRDVARPGAGADFVGIFHSLELSNLVTQRSRKLCDYLGVASVGWSGNEFIIVTQYVGKRTSRALVFSVAGDTDPVILDAPTLTRLVSVDLRPALRDNDHVFVEASRVETSTLHLSVWGYGRHDPNGFRWTCEYSLREGLASCLEVHPHQ